MLIAFGVCIHCVCVCVRIRDQIVTQGAGSAGELVGLLGPNAKVFTNGSNSVQNMIDGMYDAAIAGPTASQLVSVMRLDAIATSFKTTFFSLPKTLTRASVV